ncbi:hypothetical protein ABH931_007641 [Streptacidiphilus sp. MAP12-33]|uniref:hypothetical protein n=1 Tax=Streptacidiphilus sp. MAP12-33 TaxID=3156266 RepID=UPI003514DCFA
MSFDQHAHAFESLAAFSVRGDYGKNHTTFWVTPAGQSQPVVRMHKDFPLDVYVRPFYVYPVADPQQLLGYVKMGKAWDGQQTEIGAVGNMAWRYDRDKRPIVQHDLGTLTPERQPLTGVKRGVQAAVELVDFFSIGGPGLDQSDKDAMFSAHVRCAGPTSAGFELVRRAGVTATYDVVVHDPRVSRLLVLAFVDAFNSVSDADVRQTWTWLKRNPFRDRNPQENERMRLEKQQREGR